MAEVNNIGMVRFEDGSGNNQQFWITSDGEGNFEVWQGSEDSLGIVNRMSTAIELIGLHTRLINDEDNFFDELGVDADDWDGIKNKLWNIARGAQADPWDDQGEN